MLERFSKKGDDFDIVSEDKLRVVVRDIFQEVGLPFEDAIIATDVLVTADLRGVETHGVSNLLRSYVQRLRDGSINARPEWKIVNETATTANIDADRGHGIVICPKAMDIAIEKARSTGVGMVTVGNVRHMGMAAYYPMMALPHDMIGVAMTSSPPTVVPTFASIPRFGTNPIAVAAPAGDQPDFVFDAATSVIPDNRVHIARRLGIELLPGWLADDTGNPIMKPIPAPPFMEHKLLPLGSTRSMGSHKGFGLAAIVDILSAILTLSGPGLARSRGTFAHYVAAYQVEAFVEVDRFKNLMDEFLSTLKGTPTAPGYERVLFPGQLEWETYQIRKKQGIPLHKEVIQWFSDICQELGIDNTL